MAGRAQALGHSGDQDTKTRPCVGSLFLLSFLLREQGKKQETETVTFFPFVIMQDAEQLGYIPLPGKRRKKFPHYHTHTHTPLLPILRLPQTP